MTKSADLRGERLGLQVDVAAMTPEGDADEAQQSLLLPLDRLTSWLAPHQVRSLRGLLPFGGATQAADLGIAVRAKVVVVRETWLPYDLDDSAPTGTGPAPGGQQRRRAAREAERKQLMLTIAAGAGAPEDDLAGLTSIQLVELEEKLTTEQAVAIAGLQPVSVVAQCGEVWVLLLLSHEAPGHEANIAFPLRLRPVS